MRHQHQSVGQFLEGSKYHHQAGPFTGEANRLVGQQATAEPIHTEEGTIFPFMLHRELGHGWLFLQTEELDELQHQSLSLLCGHAANALYSTVAQGVLTARQDDDDDFDVMAI